MPFIFQCSILESMRNTFTTKRQQHFSLISRLEKTTKRQVRDSYKKLVACIKDSSIAKEEFISKCLCHIDGLLNNDIKSRSCTPPAYEVAYDFIGDICCELVEKGHGSLISEFVDIISEDRHIVDLEEAKRLHQLKLLTKRATAPFILVKEYSVKWTKFAPARRKLQEARDVLSDLGSQTPWMAYNNLCTAYWPWCTPKSYFQHKPLKYETPLSRAKSMQWIEQHTCWCEMQAIKKKNYSVTGQELFSLHHYKKHFLILENQIDLTLAINTPEMYEKKIERNTPYQYRLFVDGTELWFAVEWVKGQKSNYYMIANPQNLSSTQKFIEQISKTEAGEVIKVPDRTAADLINRSNLKGEIKNIFFGKSSTHEIKFHGLTILGHSTSRVNVVQLINEVSQLHQKHGSPEPPFFFE